MPLKLKYFITADNAFIDSNTGLLDIIRVRNTFVNPAFPAMLNDFCAIIGFEDVTNIEEIRLEIKDPNDEIVLDEVLSIEPNKSPSGIYKIINLNRIVIKSRGVYTARVYKKDGKRPLGVFKLIDAQYPPKREFEEGEINKILGQRNVIKNMNVDYKIPGTDNIYKFQLNLDKNEDISEGRIPLPDNNILVHDEKQYDLTGIRRQIEWMFGKKMDNKKK